MGADSACTFFRRLFVYEKLVNPKSDEGVDCVPTYHSIPSQKINPIRAGGLNQPALFFRWQFLHEKRGFEVPDFVTFPNSL